MTKQQALDLVHECLSYVDPNNSDFGHINLKKFKRELDALPVTDFEVMEQMVRDKMDIKSSTTVVNALEVPEGTEVTMGIGDDIEDKITNGTHACIFYSANLKQFNEIKGI